MDTKILVDNALREMSKEEIEMYVMIKDLSEQQGNELFDYIVKNGGWVLSALEKRFSAYKINVSKKVIIMIHAMGNGAIGICVKYVDDIAKWCKAKLINDISLNMFMTEIYPNGFPIF